MATLAFCAVALGEVGAGPVPRLPKRADGQYGPSPGVPGLLELVLVIFKPPVVPAAGGYELVQVGWGAELPAAVEVVDFAQMRGDLASPNHTGLIHRQQRLTLRRGGEPHGSPEVEGQPIAAQDQGVDAAVKRDPPRVPRRYRRPVQQPRRQSPSTSANISTNAGISASTTTRTGSSVINRTSVRANISTSTSTSTPRAGGFRCLRPIPTLFPIMALGGRLGRSLGPRAPTRSEVGSHPELGCSGCERKCSGQGWWCRRRCGLGGGW